MALLIAIQVICFLLPTVFGYNCEKPTYSTALESMCDDYQASSDVFTVRVINASCNCIPSIKDISYGQAAISCLSASGGSSDYFTSEIVAGATCGYQGSKILSCDRVLNMYKAFGKCKND